MPDEKNKSDDDIEAEMLRMMEQEASGTPAAGAETADSQETAPSDNLEDEMMKMMQQAMAEPQQDASAGSAPPADDQALEMEMLKAMQGDNGGGGGESAIPFPAFAPATVETAPTGGLSRLMDVNVRITVELGANQTPIKDILVWGEGTVVELERMDREPVDVLVNEKLFARGEVVVIGETFGIRITELLNGPSRR